MNFIKQYKEGREIREILQANNLPVDETLFCADISKGRVKNFGRLSKEEFLILKNLLKNFSREQLLEGLYSAAFEMGIISSEQATEADDQKIIKFLKTFELVNHKNEFKLTNKGDVMQLSSPFKSKSYYLVYVVSGLLSIAYLKRTSTLN